MLASSTVSDIASELNLSASPMSNYLVRIMSKLGVRTLQDIVSYGHRAGLVGRREARLVDVSS